MADDDLNTTLRWPGSSGVHADATSSTSPDLVDEPIDDPIDDLDVLGRLHAVEGLLGSLRGDVAGLRSVVLQLPDVQQLSQQIRDLERHLVALDPSAGLVGGQLVREMTELRTGLQSLVQSDARTLAGLGPMMEELARMQRDAAGTRDQVDAIAQEVRAIAAESSAIPATSDSSELEELVGEVAGLRSEVAQLRRRIAVRAQPTEDR